MKKVISLVMVIAMIAAFAAVASASVAHNDGHLSVWGNAPVAAGIDRWGDPCVVGPVGSGLEDLAGLDVQFGTWDVPVQIGWDGTGLPAHGAQAAAAWEVALCSQMVKVMSIGECTQKWTTCALAVTAKELDACAEEVEGFKNLTVFRQREVSAEEEVELSVKLWPCGKKNATVVIFRAEGTDEWTVVGCGEKGDKVVDCVLPGSGSYAVCLAW